MLTIYKRNCDYCKKYYEGYGKYFCSPFCRNTSRRGQSVWNQGLKGWTKKYKNVGFQKGNKIWLGKYHTKESKERMREFWRGKRLRKNNPAWKGGEFRSTMGYIYVLKPRHPNAMKMGYVRRSRLIVEKYLGRLLTELEVIHHINGAKDDDRPENLYLFSLQSEHSRYEKSKNKLILKSNLL